MSEIGSAVSYIADAMRILTENTANLSGGRYITAAFADAVRGSFDYSAEYADTGEEIIGRIREKLRD